MLFISDFQPLALRVRPKPFDNPNWLFELKYDGFRALACVRDGRCQLVSRNGNAFATFGDLCLSLAEELSCASTAVLDGEIVCLDGKGRPQFEDLLYRRDHAYFIAFDLLHRDGEDLRSQRLLERKQALRVLLGGSSSTSRLRFADHVEGSGIALFERVCHMDLEGIVAKHMHEPYAHGSRWYKIRNANYSQKVGRDELFERERHEEPVAGWHSCDLACADSAL